MVNRKLREGKKRKKVSNGEREGGGERQKEGTLTDIRSLFVLSKLGLMRSQSSKLMGGMLLP